ncbi:uncharacterized protein PAE49_007274 isoform 2-T2 [Odontesthes bonariensis]
MSAALSATNQSIPEKVDRDQSLQRFGLDGRIAVSEAPAAKTFPENTKGRTTWLSRLFSRILKKDQIQTKSNNKPSEQKQRVDSSDGATTTTAPQPEEKNKQRKKKKSCWRLFSCCRVCSTGHYTSEGLHPDEALRNQSDRWLHYDDRVIFETSRAVVREWRQKTCYVLFYQRQLHQTQT